MPLDRQGFGPAHLTKKVGIVIIGRNEGERLKRCLESISPKGLWIVYVDSGSMDNSVDFARGAGADVIELDMSVPFCAARARNVGYQKLVESAPQLIYVQFIDGDCELISHWLPFAAESLSNRPNHAIVAGWLREKSPEISIYNRLGDLEWNFSGAGEVDAVGGIFMIRRKAFESVGGFDSTVAAGEEPELCKRLIRKGWRLVRLDRDMALHDLAMTRFGQWWQRMVRNGYGSMDVALRFEIAKFVRMNSRARFWTVWLVMTLVLGVTASVFADSFYGVLVVFLMLSIWPARFLRIALQTWQKGQPLGTSMAYAFFMVISFLPQIVGQILYFSDRLRNRSFRLVEYKAPVSSDSRQRR